MPSFFFAVHWFCCFQISMLCLLDHCCIVWAKWTKLNICNSQTLINAKYCSFLWIYPVLTAQHTFSLLHTRKVCINVKLNETTTNSIEFTEQPNQGGQKKRKRKSNESHRVDERQTQVYYKCQSDGNFFVFLFDVIKTHKCVWSLTVWEEERAPNNMPV